MIQTELGDLLIETCVPAADDSLETPKKCIVETHSEHLILRILRRIRETTEGELSKGAREVKPDDVAVHYFEVSQDGTKVTRLRIRDDGEFLDRWPYGFFDERTEELF
jgi:predicted ATPase